MRLPCATAGQQLFLYPLETFKTLWTQAVVISSLRLQYICRYTSGLFLHEVTIVRVQGTEQQTHCTIYRNQGRVSKVGGNIFIYLSIYLSSWFFKTVFFCVALKPVLELTLQIRLALNSQKSACLCLPSAGIKDVRRYHPAVGGNIILIIYF